MMCYNKLEQQKVFYLSQRNISFKSEIFEIFCNTVEARKIFFKHYLFSVGHQRPTNGEYITNFLDVSGAQGSHPKTGLSNTFMSIKIDRVIRFCSTFFLKLGIDGGQEKMYTSDPSATYVSGNPGQKLETKIFVSHLGIRQLEN